MTTIYKETDLEKDIKKKFKNLSNEELVQRANSLPDFKWDDEEVEISRRMKVSNGKFKVEMVGNQLKIIS